MTELQGNEYREQRLANMRALLAAGYAPYGAAFARSGTLAEIRAAFEVDRRVTAAGRLMTIRDMGKSLFADIRDGSDRFQIYVQNKRVGEDAAKAFKLLDMGDHIGVEGTLFTTRTGEQTLAVEKWTMLSKALLPLPEKWHGLRDVEARYRQRYLDLASQPAVREVFNRRSEAISEMRRYLAERGFAEVETPMIQPQAGGAAARPFVTRYEALSAEMFLRIAPELYLKQLLVGGFDKVFELNRCFRNEGLSRTHNPEFTMLEVYEAYTNVDGMKDLVQGLVTRVAEHVFGTLRIEQVVDASGDAETVTRPAIDLTPPWREATYRDLVRERMGADWFDLALGDARGRAEETGLTLDPAWDMTMVTHEVYEKLIEGSLMQPTFVTRFPAALIPLARTCPDDPGCVDVFELVIAGSEIAPGYTELNDPLAQRERLLQQAGGDGSALDETFLTALEHGMPPAGGMGMGVDRLIMILAGQDSLRDVILFPQLRTKGR